MVHLNPFKKSVCGKKKLFTKKINQKSVDKKIAMSTFKNFDKLIEKTRQFAKDKGINSENIEGAIKRARK